MKKYLFAILFVFTYICNLLAMPGDSYEPVLVKADVKKFVGFYLPMMEEVEELGATSCTKNMLGDGVKDMIMKSRGMKPFKIVKFMTISIAEALDKQNKVLAYNIKYYNATSVGLKKLYEHTKSGRVGVYALINSLSPDSEDMIFKEKGSKNPPGVYDKMRVLNVYNFKVDDGSEKGLIMQLRVEMYLDEEGNAIEPPKLNK